MKRVIMILFVVAIVFFVGCIDSQIEEYIPKGNGGGNVNPNASDRGEESINYFSVTNSKNGNPISQAIVKITWNNQTIDYGPTDSDGQFISYLDPYKMYTVIVSKNLYNTANYTFYGTSSTTHDIELQPQPKQYKRTAITFKPKGNMISDKTLQYLRVRIENWHNVKNITIAVSDKKEFIDMWQDMGSTMGVDVYSWTLDKDNPSSWCNSSTYCKGDSEVVEWTVMDTALNNYGSSGQVYVKAIANTYNGEQIEASRM